MKPSNFSRIAVISAGIAAATAAFVACTSSSTNPTPVVPFDSGSPNNPDTSVPPAGDSSVNPGDSNAPPGIDANLPDVGSCVSDASTCNSCYTPAQNPLNGCSPATVNCIPYDNSKIPTGAP